MNRVDKIFDRLNIKRDLRSYEIAKSKICSKIISLCYKNLNYRAIYLKNNDEFVNEIQLLANDLKILELDLKKNCEGS